MNHKKRLKTSAIMPVIIGILIGAILFWGGMSEDAPGLCLIGISIAFILTLWGTCNAGFLKKSQLAHIISLCFGLGFLVLSIVLQLDGEFEEIPYAFFVGLSLGFMLICFGIVKWLKYKKTK